MAYHLRYYHGLPSQVLPWHTISGISGTAIAYHLRYYHGLPSQVLPWPTISGTTIAYHLRNYHCLPSQVLKLHVSPLPTEIVFPPPGGARRSFRGRPGVSLGSFWGHVGVALASLWHRSGTTLGAFSGAFRTHVWSKRKTSQNDPGSISKCFPI